MSDINWRHAWDTAVKDPSLFHIKQLTKSTLSIACPTRFSAVGEFSIDFTPSFNEDSITLSMLTFNDNLSLDDLDIDHREIKQHGDDNYFNRLAKDLVEFELSNRLASKYTIKSDGFDSEEEATDTLIAYINDKATESGRMFDDTLDKLNDEINVKDEGYNRVLESIKQGRCKVLAKVSSILCSNYKWRTSKNEDFSDSTMSLYDSAGNLAAVVSLVDSFVIVDLAKGITAKVSMLKSDEEIEAELTNDVDNAQTVIANREIEDLKDAVEDNRYIESLERRLTKLESMYINKRFRRYH